MANEGCIFFVYFKDEVKYEKQVTMVSRDLWKIPTCKLAERKAITANHLK